MPYLNLPYAKRYSDEELEKQAQSLEKIFCKPVTEGVVKHNCKVKKYPDGSLYKTTCKLPIFTEKGALKKRDDDVIEECWLKNKDKRKSNRERSDELIKRHRDRVRDIILMNDFKYFITITLDKEKLDRYDKGEFKKKLRNWLTHQVQRKGLQYVLIPEYHKDGALHAHALVNDVFTLVDSGHKDNAGRTVYNVPEWKYGFSTAIELDDNKIKVGNYVMKYITKGSDKIFGKYFWSSKNIKREPEITLCDEDFDGIKAEVFQPLKFYDELQFKYDCWIPSGDEITILPDTAPRIFVTRKGERIEYKTTEEFLKLVAMDNEEDK